MKPDVGKFFADVPYISGKLHISFRSIEIGPCRRHVGPNPDKQLLTAAFASHLVLAVPLPTSYELYRTLMLNDWSIWRTLLFCASVVSVYRQYVPDTDGFKVNSCSVWCPLVSFLTPLNCHALSADAADAAFLLLIAHPNYV